MSVRKQISEYLIKNHIDRADKNPYDRVAALFGVSTEVVRGEWRKLRSKGLVEGDQPLKDKERLFIQHNKKDGFRQDGKSAEVVKTTNKRVKTLKDLISVCEIDTKEWNIVSWECNKWEVGAKTDDGKIVVEPLFQVKAKLSQKQLDTDLGLQKELLLNELKQHSPVVKRFKYDNFTEAECLLEIALFDVHFGKMSNKGETSDNYDLKIAEKRFKKAVQELLKRVNLSLVNKILFPIGNDLLHIDNIKATTFNETPMETDTRFHKLVKTVKRILIETIDELSTIAPVDVVVVVGNHDTTASFMIGEVLDAWYYNNPNVTVNNSPKMRKYYKFGKNGFQFTHGDSEKHTDLGIIFATEEPKIWAGTTYRFCQLGHLHKQKKTNYVSVDTHQGFQVQILPSLSSQDRWHYSKGYMSLKQAKAFMYHPTEGQIAEYTYSC